MNEKKDDNMGKIVGAAVVATVLSIGLLWLGKCLVSCAYDRWVSTEGFWQASLANFQLGIAESILGIVGSSFAMIVKHMALKTKQEYRVFLLGAVVVFLFGVFLCYRIYDIADGLWFNGFFNTLFFAHVSLVLCMFAVPSFTNIMKLIKKA